MKVCRKCGEMFNYNEGEDWKKDCLPCWLKEKNGEKKAAPKHVYETRGAEKILRDEIKALKMKIFNMESEMRWQAMNTKPSSQFDAATLKRIRMLVHPDKHGNSAMSNEITQLINKLIN